MTSLSIKKDILPTRKKEIKYLVANEIVSLIHTWQVTWIRLLIMIWRTYCGNTFKLTEWLINFEVKKFTIISCARRGEKVHWWRPAGLITVPRGEPAFPGVLSKLAGLCLPRQEVAARPWSPVRCSLLLLLGTRRPGSVFDYELLQLPHCGRDAGERRAGSGCWGKCSERFAVCG